MFQQLLKGAASGLFWILQLAAEFSRRAADESHFVFGGWKRPFGISRRHVFAGKVGGLVTGVAPHAVDTTAILAAPYILQMDVTVVALQRRVAGWVTVLAARRSEDSMDL